MAWNFQPITKKLSKICYLRWKLLHQLNFNSKIQIPFLLQRWSENFSTIRFIRRQRPDVHSSSSLQLLVYIVPFFTSTLAKQSWMEQTASNGNIPSQFTTKWTHTLYTQPRSDHSNHYAMKWWGMTLCCHRTMITIYWTTTSSMPGSSATMCLTYQQVRVRMFWATHR